MIARNGRPAADSHLKGDLSLKFVGSPLFCDKVCRSEGRTNLVTIFSAAEASLKLK